MKKIVLYLALTILIVSPSYAQLSKKIIKYHDQKGITITLLDQNLYNLYQKDNLSSESKKMLQNLENIYILDIDLKVCAPEISKNIIQTLQQELASSSRYQLVKSKNLHNYEQAVYVRQKNNTITDLIVYENNNSLFKFIELRGNIQLEKIGLLPNTLHLPEILKFDFILHSTAKNKRLTTVAPQIQKKGHSLPYNKGIPTQINKSSVTPTKKVQASSNSNQQVKKRLLPPVLGINTKNTKPIFIVDGQNFSEQQIFGINMDEIRNVWVKHDHGTQPTTSYIFIHTKRKMGKLFSFKNNVIEFEHRFTRQKFILGDQDYKRILLNNKILEKGVSIDPATVKQIRKANRYEEKFGPYPGVQLYIYTE